MKILAATACLAILFTIHPVHGAKAAPCDNKGSSDRLHYGSNVSGESVTICAEYWWPKVNTVVKPKPAPATPTKVDPNWFVVTPTKPKAFSTSKTSLSPDQLFEVDTNASVHQLKKVLIGRFTQVRFTPVKVFWRFGDHQASVGKTVLHSFKNSGTYSVYATVSYAVKFRFIGTTKWISEPRTLSIKTNSLTFRVSNSAPKVSGGRPLLVFYDCGEIQRTGC